MHDLPLGIKFTVHAIQFFFSFFKKEQKLIRQLGKTLDHNNSNIYAKNTNLLPKDANIFSRPQFRHKFC